MRLPTHVIIVVMSLRVVIGVVNGWAWNKVTAQS
jgi:hypothetical protein